VGVGGGGGGVGGRNVRDTPIPAREEGVRYFEI